MAGERNKDTAIGLRVIRSTFSNYLGKGIAIIAGVLLTPFILNALGPTVYGLWALAGSLVGYGLILDFGIGNALVKYVAEYRTRDERHAAEGIVTTALAFYIVLGLLTILAAWLFAPHFPTLFRLPPEQHDLARRLILLMGSGIGLSIPCATTTAILRGLQRFDLANALSTISTLLGAVGTVLVLGLGGGVLGLVAVQIGAMLFIQLPSIWWIRRVAPEIRITRQGLNRQAARTVVGFSASLFVGSIADRLQTKSDQIVIGAFLPVRLVTPYAITQRMSEMAQLLTDQFMKVLLPLASELHAENDQSRLRALYLTSTRLTLAIFVPLGGILVMLAAPLLSAWVGPEYAQYSILVTILTAASLISTTQWPAASVLQGMARHRLLAVTAIVTGLANLAISLVMVQRLGLTGVALGTLIPAALEGLVVLPYTMRIIGVSPAQALRESFVPALLPGLPMLALLYGAARLLPLDSLPALALVGGVALLVYAAGYLTLGASQMERHTYRTLLRHTLRRS